MVRARPLLAALLTACCLLAAVVAAPPQAAAEVLVVLSSDKAPYLQALEGLRAPLAAQGHQLVARKLEELAAQPVLDTAACVVAVGTQAAVWLREHPPAHAP